MAQAPLVLGATLESSFAGNSLTAAARRAARRRQIERALLALCTVPPALVLVMSALHWLLPQRTGILALTQIFAPYIYLALLPLLPFALSRYGRPLRWLLLACAAVFALRFGPGALHGPRAATPGATTVAVLSWNIYVDNRSPAIAETIASAPEPIVALQELTDAQRDALVGNAAVAERYPYQILRPNGASGMGLLSHYPILESGQLLNPDVPLPHYLLWARLDLGGGKTLVVVNAHPRPGSIGFLDRAPVPVDFDPTIRDAEIAYIRGIIAPRLAAGEPLLLVGDFNTTEREPAYGAIAAGLQDAQLAVGRGPGLSWRPSQLLQIPLALIRIDYQLASPQLRPLELHADCTVRGSDHCALHGVFELVP